MSLRTPLKDVRRLGSAHEGTGHFVRQRLTAIALVLLVPVAVWFVTRHAGADYETVRAAIAKPWIGLALLLLVGTAAAHMRIGMQVIIEDYVHGEGTKLVLLLLNTFFAIFVAAASAFAILKISFGG
jgi:succinate dehydrogenase / fumarate reductase membrane anchor subunit